MQVNKQNVITFPEEVAICLLGVTQNKIIIVSLGLLAQNKTNKEAIPCPYLVWKDPTLDQKRKAREGKLKRVVKRAGKTSISNLPKEDMRRLVLSDLEVHVTYSNFKS